MEIKWNEMKQNEGKKMFKKKTLNSTGFNEFSKTPQFPAFDIILNWIDKPYLACKNIFHYEAKIL